MNITLIMSDAELRKCNYLGFENTEDFNYWLTSIDDERRFIDVFRSFLEKNYPIIQCLSQEPRIRRITSADYIFHFNTEQDKLAFILKIS